MGVAVVSGRWYSILEALNLIGVVTNAFIIAFTSQWGVKYSNDPVVQVWIVLGFEV